MASKLAEVMRLEDQPAHTRRLRTKLLIQLQRLRTLGVVSTDRNDYDEVIARIATRCERAAHALINVNTWAKTMGVQFPNGLVGEDPTTDLTGTDSTLYETEALAGSLANLDKLIAANGQIPPARGTLHARNQPGELVPFFEETDELYLSMLPGEFSEFDNLLTENERASSAMETNDPTSAQESDLTNTNLERPLILLLCSESFLLSR